MERKIERILLTGGCGFIGSNLSHWLLENTDIQKLIVLDCLDKESGSTIENLPVSERLIFKEGNYGDGDLIMNLLEEYSIDGIFHLAAETHVDRSYKDPIKCAYNNIINGIQLIDQANKYGKLKIFFLMSTDEIYGDHCIEGSDETMLPRPTNPYSASKASLEQYIWSYYYSYKLPCVILRSNNIYGIRQHKDKVLPKFITRLFKGKSLKIHGSGEQTRSWLHVDDACEAIWKVANKGKIAEVYNIGSNDELSINEIANRLFNYMQSKNNTISDTLPIIHDKDRPHNDKFYHLNWSKIGQELGWEPKISIYDSLPQVVDWYIDTLKKKHPWKFLIYGSKGWIAKQCISVLKNMGIYYVEANTRPGNDDDEKIQQEILKVKPTHVLCLLGRTSGPGEGTQNTTIDYLEGSPDKTNMNVRDNLYAPLTLAFICRDNGIHLTYLGTGCIFEYPENNPEKYSQLPESFNKEQDRPNFFGSSYSVVKGYTDRLLHRMEKDVLNVRIRMPVSNEIHKREFITKISGYKKVVNIPNSVTVLPELLPIMIDMAIKKKTGTINLVNPDPISHNEILEMYKEIIDSSFEINNFTLEEQSKILKSGRSNCALDTTLLTSMYQVKSSKESIRDCLLQMVKK